MTKREDNPNAAEFRLQPLERGYGHTLGNSLRRMLLSSLRGAAVWAFRLDGVVHEHQTIPVETNGTISPEDAVAYAAALAQEHFRFFVDFGKVPMIAAPETAPGNGGGAATGQLRELLNRSIDDVGLSVRSVNSLKNSNIRTLADLVQYREDDLLKVKNVGEKALAEIAELLRREGLNFGMRFEDVNGELKIADPGAPPMAQPGLGGDD